MDIFRFCLIDTSTYRVTSKYFLTAELKKKGKKC